MPPKKLTPQKKKQKTTEASSSRARQKDLLSDQPYAKERQKQLEEKKILNHCYLDWSLLREYGMEERIRNMVTDETWFKLFALREPAYKEVTMEFLSTMMVENDGNTNTLTFQAYEETHTIDLKQVGVILGLYASEEEVAHLPNSFPNHMTDSRYWLELIKPKTEDFVPSKSLSTIFTDMEPKLLHHILAHTISCKKTSHSKVTSFDMFYLFSLITGYRIDLGVEVANFMDRQVTDTRTRNILCGGYITALLKGMNIFRLPEGDEGVQSKKISSGPFRTWGLLKAPAHIDPAAEAEEEEIQPTDIPSTSQATPDNAYDLLRTDIREIKEDIRREKKKNKKFRTTIFKALKSAFSCFNAEAAEQFHYETSSDETSSTEPES